MQSSKSKILRCSQNCLSLSSKVKFSAVGGVTSMGARHKVVRLFSSVSYYLSEFASPLMVSLLSVVPFAPGKIACRPNYSVKGTAAVARGTFVCIVAAATYLKR